MEEIQPTAYHDDIGLLTQDDMAFIHETLGHDILSVEEMNTVLNNPKLRKQVLDSPALYEALVKNKDKLCVSEFFYFTITARQVLLTAGLQAQEYTQNVARSLVRMSNMRRKLLDRMDSNTRYAPVNLKVLIEDGNYGSNLKISCAMPPYEMVLEGFLANLSAFKHTEGSLLHPQGNSTQDNNFL